MHSATLTGTEIHRGSRFLDDSLMMHSATLTGAETKLCLGVDDVVCEDALRDPFGDGNRMLFSVDPALTSMHSAPLAGTAKTVAAHCTDLCSNQLILKRAKTIGATSHDETPMVFAIKRIIASDFGKKRKI